MNILLYGEYSGIHSNLVANLVEKGFNVDFLSTGDGFKNLNGNIKIRKRGKGFFNKIFTDITNFEVLNEIGNKHYEVVQFVNPLPGIVTPYFGIESHFIERIINSSNKSFLYASGCDYGTQKIFNQLQIFDGLCVGCQKDYGVTKCPQHRSNSAAWHSKFMQIIDGIFSGLEGAYSDEYADSEKFRGYIPFPVDLLRTPYKRQEFGKKIKILHGINRYWTKGSDQILDQLKILEEKYANSFEVEIVEKLPFDDYLQKVYQSNIVIDQMYGDGLGMNALQTMAMGRIILTSYDKNYTFSNNPAIPIGLKNKSIVESLVALSELSSKQLDEISINAHDYVKDNHESKKIADLFIDNWKM